MRTWNGEHKVRLQSIGRNASGLRPLFVSPAYFREHLFHCDGLHAPVVAAGRLAVAEHAHTRAANDAGPENPAARRARPEQIRRLRPEQRDHVNRSQGRKMCRSAVVRHQHLGQRVEHKQLPQRGLAGHRKAAVGADLADQFAVAAASFGAPVKAHPNRRIFRQQTARQIHVALVRPAAQRQ